MESIADQLAATVARSLDRRSFLRKAAGTTFKAAAILAAGGSLAEISSTPAFAECGGPPGYGCPTTLDYLGNRVSLGCGTSRCCNGLRNGNANCNCASGTTCLSRAGYCYGPDHRDYRSPGPNCWTCSVLTRSDPNGCDYGYVTTCCDCLTNRTNCADPNIDNSNYGRCIGFSYVYKKFGC